MKLMYPIGYRLFFETLRVQLNIRVELNTQTYVTKRFERDG